MSFNVGAGIVSFPHVCKGCKPPKRGIHCHEMCKEYLEAKAKHTISTEAVRKEKQAERDADGASFRMKRN